MQIATPKCAEGRSADDSLTKSAGTRKRLLVHLAGELRALDDLEAARVVHEALDGSSGTQGRREGQLPTFRRRGYGVEGGTRWIATLAGLLKVGN